MHPLSPPPLKAWFTAALAVLLLLAAAILAAVERKTPNFQRCPLCHDPAPTVKL